MHVTERMDRNLAETAREMIMDSVLSKQWWGQEILYTTEIRYR